MIVGQGPIAIAVGACCLDIFTFVYLFFSLSPSLWETTRYKLKYCLKGPLNPKQPINQWTLSLFHMNTSVIETESAPFVSLILLSEDVPLEISLVLLILHFPMS